MDRVEIRPLEGPLDADVRVVGSKSYTNRALILAALADGTTTLSGALFSDDTRYMAGALTALGIDVEADAKAKTFIVQGAGGRVPAAEAKVFVGNAGTAARFLPVLMSLGQGVYEMDGIARMHERPIGPLIDALHSLGGKVESLGQPNCVPLRVHGVQLAGGTVRIPGHLSSQYISGLLMGAPCMRDGLTIDIEGELVSRPYLDMTVQAMEAFGARVQREGERRFVVPGAQTYQPTTYAVEPDASAASYFFAAAAVCGGRVRVQGLGTGSLQGDLGLVHILQRMGCTVEQGQDWTELRGPGAGGLTGVEVDMADLSDVAQTLAVVAPFASSPTRITGIGFIRRKETDRVGAVVTELNRLGIVAQEEDDGLRIEPGTPRPAEVHTYDDHRMAMSFAVLGLRAPGVVIQDPSCTAKTFPEYFEVLDELSA